MSPVATTLRSLRERAVARAVDRVAARAAAETAEPVVRRIEEVRRILGDQGDAADEVAEAIGRALTRLSAEVAALTDELGRLRERLDRLEHAP